MAKLSFVVFLSISSSLQFACAYSSYGYARNNFATEKDIAKPYYNYKNAPRFDIGASFGGSDNRLRLEGPFDMTAYLVQSCPKKIPVEPRLVNDAVKCMEEQLTDEILSQSLIMLASRQFQQFGAKTCQVWPNVSLCLTEVIAYLEECQEKQYIGKVTDRIINYLCSRPKGAPEGTNNFGDFLLAGGLSCVDINGFAQCMKDVKDENQKNTNFCVTIQTLRDCGKPSFVGCFSPKPWEIISGGLDDLEDQFSCGALEGPAIISSNGTTDVTSTIAPTDKQ